MELGGFPRRESGPLQGRRERIVQLSGVRTGRGTHEQFEGRRMREHDLSGGVGELCQLVPPVAGSPRSLELRVDEVGHAVEQVVLPFDVAVESHRCHAEAVGDAPQAHALEPVRVGEPEAGCQHGVPGQCVASRYTLYTSGMIGDLARSRYISLTTFRSDGTEASTPVWVVSDDGSRLLVWTGASTWKAKRIRRDPNVRVAASSIRGAERGSRLDGRARVLGDAVAPLVHRLLRDKYGWQKQALDLQLRLSRSPGPGSVYIEITARVE